MLHSSKKLFSRAFISLALILTCAIQSRAEDFTYNGLTYTTLTANTCETKQGDDIAGNSVSGDIVIPETVYDSNGNAYTVTAIGDHAFINSTELTSIAIPNSVTKIGFAALMGCTELTAVSIGNSVTEIEAFAFVNCTGLISVTIPDSVTKIQFGAFNGCVNLTSVTIGNSVTVIGADAFCNCSRLASVIIGNSVTEIGDGAFSGCEGLVKCAYPSSLSNPFGWRGMSISYPIGAIIEDGIIWDANKSEIYFVSIVHEGEFTIPDTVTKIGDNAFSYCTGLTSVSIPNSVATIGESAFWNCTGLTSVTIGNSVTTIEESAFRGCESLKSIELPPYLSTLERRTFMDCSELETVYIGKYLSYIDEEDVFYDCFSLQNFIVDEDNYYYASNSTGALYNKDYSAILLCPPGKITFDIPETVTAIGESAFSDCSKLISVNIPNSVTSIEAFAFNECSSIVHLVIPGSVTSISDYAFYECLGLKSVTCMWTEPLPVITDEWVFSSEIYENCPLYVPIGTKEKYANTATWCKFENIYERNVSGVHEISNESGARVSVDDGAICVDGDAEVSIVAMNGATVYSGYGENRINVAPGVYVVIVGDAATKVAVK
jgi:hypothetical protein